MKDRRHILLLPRFVILAALIAVAFTLTARADDAPAPHRKPDVKLWKADQAKGKDALAKNDLPAAEKWFQAALDEAQNFDAKDVRFAESLKSLAETYYAEENKSAAEPLLRRATEVLYSYASPREEVLVLLEYGALCTELRHYDDAIKSFQRVQSLAERHLGRSDPAAVEATTMLAEVYVRKGDYAAAEPLLKRSFEMFRSPMTRVELTQPGGGALFGHDVRRLHYKPNYAYALESAARLNFVYLKENKPAEAAAILKQALELVDKNTSTSDTVFPETIYGFGLSCVINDNLEGAESVFDRLITLTGKAKGPAKNAAFESALRLQTSLADTLIKKQKLADAELLYTSLSSAADKNFGPDSRESDEALVTLTQYYLNHDQAAKAEPLFQRQLAHAEKFQPDGPALAPILAGLETVYSTLGRDPELDAVYQKQIVVYEKVFGQNSVGLVKPLNARAALLHKLKRDAEAEPLEARANAITAAQTK